MESLEHINHAADNNYKTWTKYFFGQNIFKNNYWKALENNNNNNNKKTEIGKESTLERWYQQGEKFKYVAFCLRALTNSCTA